MDKFLPLLALLAGAVILGIDTGSGAQSESAVAVATPVADYAHPEWLVNPAWLADHLDDSKLAIIALTPADEFVAGHIPGAAQIDWPAMEIVETSDQSIENWRREVERLLTGMSVERTDTVVVYDGGTFYASRMWWILFQLGHEDVRVLNGGLEAWTAEDGELETGESAADPAKEPYVGEPNMEAIATIGEVEAAHEEGAAVFVDARSAEEYVEGHIPGAVNVPFTDNAEAEDPKYWKSVDELRSMYEALGVSPDKQVIAYCTTGVRSSVTYFTLRQLGYENVTLFTGSYKEWSSDADRPITTGDQP